MIYVSPFENRLYTIRASLSSTTYLFKLIIGPLFILLINQEIYLERSFGMLLCVSIYVPKCQLIVKQSLKKGFIYFFYFFKKAYNRYCLPTTHRQNKLNEVTTKLFGKT